MTARCDRTAAWQELRQHFESSAPGFDLRRAFEADPARFERFSQPAPQVFADLSKNLIDARAEELLFALARQCGIGLMSIWAIEKGRQMPGLDTAIAIARALDVRVDDLLEEVES